MKKNPTYATRHKKSSDALDWSYVEMQEHDFLVNESQEGININNILLSSIQ